MSSEGRTEAKNNKIHSLLFLYFSATGNGRFETMGTGHRVQELPRGTAKGPPASFRRALPSPARTGQGLASNSQCYSLIQDGGGDIILGTGLAYRAHSPLLHKNFEALPGHTH